MSRPSDWWVLDLDRDPVPGAPGAVRSMARSWSGLADDAEYAETRVRQLMGDGAIGAWIGEAGDAFREKTGDLPDQLGRCKSSYRLASEALSWWADRLAVHQADADAALVKGRAAHADLEEAKARAAAAAASLSSAAGSNVLADAAKYAHHPPVDPSLVPTDAQVSAARGRLASARAASASADAAVAAAQSRLEHARALALDAASLRDGDARRTADRVHEASDAGIPERSRWEKLKDWAAKAWDVIITIAKVVVAVLGVIALIIGGPLAWVVFAAALLILADTIMKYMQGKASLWDVAFAALSCIPGTKGLTSFKALSEAFEAGGTLGVLGELGGSLRTAGVGVLRMAQRLRQGALPAVTRIVVDLPGLARAAGEESNAWGGARVFWKGLQGSRRAAVDDAWAAHLVDLGRTDPAKAAGRWQGYGAYPGVDAWSNDTLSVGSHLEAGWPGTSGFVVPDGTIASVGDDASRLADGTQVAPSASFDPPLRSSAMRFHTTVDVPAATSVTAANPQYGAGGLTQHYVPDFNALVARGDVRAVDAAGRPVHASLTEWGGLKLDLPDGPTIHLSNPYPAAGVPTGDAVAAQALRTRDLAPWAATPWRMKEAGGHGS